MDNLNIYTLLMAIRGLSNEITVRSLADQLGISYSTLARCKSGAWPRSITLDAMRAVLEGCRTRYFNDDGDALSRSLLMQLRSQEVNTTILDAILKGRGYESFLAELLMCSSDPAHAKKLEDAWENAANQRRSTQLEGGNTTGACEESHANDNDTSLASCAGEHAQRLQDLMLALPVALVLLMGLFNVSLSSCFGWADEHRASFVLISALIAVAPALCGCLIDAPLAWIHYRKECPDATFTLRDFALTARLGAPTGYVAGAGRYNLSLAYLAYQPVCNVFGMMCYVSLFLFLASLPGFRSFFEMHEWVEYLKVGIVVASLVAYGHMRDQYASPCANSCAQPFNVGVDNPDNYLPTRVHVWANSLHLVWTLSLLIVLLLSLLAYSMGAYQTLETPPLMLWPYLQAMLFFAYACTSHNARSVRTRAVGAFVPGVLTTSTGFALLSVTCYVPSWTGAALCLLCIANSLIAWLWARRKRKQAEDAWIVEGRGSRAYSIGISVCIAVLFTIGMLTSSLI